jgi:hypothetical protein
MRVIETEQHAQRPFIALTAMRNSQNHSADMDVMDGKAADLLVRSDAMHGHESAAMPRRAPAVPGHRAVDRYL